MRFCIDAIFVFTMQFVYSISGIDVGYRIKREAARAAGVTLTLESRFFRGERNCSLMDRLYEEGRLGKKTGKIKTLKYLQNCLIMH